MAQLGHPDAIPAAPRLLGVERWGDSLEPRQLGPSSPEGLARALNGVTAEGVFPPFDAEIVSFEGLPVEVRVHIRTVPEEAQPWGLCMVTFVDMSEARRAALAQQEAVKAAEAANQAKSDF